MTYFNREQLIPFVIFGADYGFNGQVTVWASMDCANLDYSFQNSYDDLFSGTMKLEIEMHRVYSASGRTYGEALSKLFQNFTPDQQDRPGTTPALEGPQTALDSPRGPDGHDDTPRA